MSLTTIAWLSEGDGLTTGENGRYAHRETALTFARVSGVPPCACR